MTDLLDTILAAAARSCGSAAERDYDLASGGAGGIGDAIYWAAATRLGVPAGQWPSQAGVTGEQMAEAQAAIRAEVGPALNTHIEHAKSRAYTDWHRGSRQPIRYAD